MSDGVSGFHGNESVTVISSLAVSEITTVATNTIIT